MTEYFTTRPSALGFVGPICGTGTKSLPVKKSQTYGHFSYPPASTDKGGLFLYFFIAPQSFSGEGLVFKWKLVTTERV